MRDSKEKPLTLLLSFIAVPVIAVWSAYVVTVLWRWFMVPLGAPAIGKAQAYGLGVLAGLLRAKAPAQGEEQRSLGYIVVYSAIAPAAALLAGWLAHKAAG